MSWGYEGGGARRLGGLEPAGEGVAGGGVLGRRGFMVGLVQLVVDAPCWALCLANLDTREGQTANPGVRVGNKPPASGIERRGKSRTRGSAVTPSAAGTHRQTLDSGRCSKGRAGVSRVSRGQSPPAVSGSLDTREEFLPVQTAQKGNMSGSSRPKQ